MTPPSYNELTEQLAWSKLRVDQLDAQCEFWRNQALMAHSKLRTLEHELHTLQGKLEHSLPLCDPDEYLPS